MKDFLMEIAILEAVAKDRPFTYLGTLGAAVTKLGWAFSQLRDAILTEIKRVLNF